MARRKRARLILTAVSGAALLSGCSARNEDILDFLQAHKHEVSAIEYRVGIPDAISISSPRILEIDGVMQTIKPDGKITLRLLGDVRVVGLTTKEIARKIEVLLSRYYVDPKVSVTITNYASKKYYVFNESGAGGYVPYTGRDTILDVVAGAGTSFLSWTSHVEVTRPHPTEEGRRVIRVDVEKMLKTGDTSANILIEPDDIVRIPPTPVAWLGFKIRELLWPISPVLEAYTQPARVAAAKDVYDDDDDDGGNSGQNGITITGRLP